ncbi:hypothetical protein T05_14258 [Trichinella murrelli]|uniref:Uncharacterized protein n=1 Tax=Trichinella murrelli TaxID=144512 RepID=A0A0V0T095_9BILA|nr:hypothetical protein T05_14258 [Trichinella murrelli]
MGPTVIHYYFAKNSLRELHCTRNESLRVFSVNVTNKEEIMKMSISSAAPFEL